MPRSLPKLSKPAARPRGPALYKLGSKPRRTGNLFLNPPLQFASPTTSNQEWIVYAALALVTGSPEDPTKPPYLGGDRWTYQEAIEGGRQFRGGQVVDFVYDNRIGLRTQTTYWHLQQGSQLYWEDIFLKTHQQSLPLIIDLFDQHYLPVGDGSAACRVVKLALKGIQLPDPFRTGTLQPAYLGI